MVAQAVLNVVVAIGTSILGRLPSGDLSALFESVTSAATTAGAAVGPWDTFVPMTELLGVAVLLTAVWLPVVLGYTVFRWVWRHLPSIAGFNLGPG